MVIHAGWQSGVQMAVHPLAAGALLGVPAGELAGRDEHAVDVTRFAGLPPGRWLAAASRSVQDAAAQDPAGSAA